MFNEGGGGEGGGFGDILSQALSQTGVEQFDIPPLVTGDSTSLLNAAAEAIDNSLLSTESSVLTENLFSSLAQQPKPAMPVSNLPVITAPPPAQPYAEQGEAGDDLDLDLLGDGFDLGDLLASDDGVAPPINMQAPLHPPPPPPLPLPLPDLGMELDSLLETNGAEFFDATVGNLEPAPVAMVAPSVQVPWQPTLAQAPPSTLPVLNVQDVLEQVVAPPTAGMTTPTIRMANPVPTVIPPAATISSQLAPVTTATRPLAIPRGRCVCVCVLFTMQHI